LGFTLAASPETPDSLGPTGIGTVSATGSASEELLSSKMKVPKCLESIE
jgi:hypothetical protein